MKNKIKEIIEWTLKLYSMTLIIPITMTIVDLLFVGILDLPTKYGFLYGLKVIWIDYYFTGYFLGIIAWKIQLCLLIISLIINIIKSYE